MDIKSGCGYPASHLSNFHPYRFEVDGIECYSMEGFLQSLKFKDINIQVEICKLVGSTAKKVGSKKGNLWKKDQTLYWRGKPIKRDSQEYQDLLDKAFNQLALNVKFRKNLLASRSAVLKHSIGKNKINDTTLTTREFCGRLMVLRRIIAEEDK